MPLWTTRRTSRALLAEVGGHDDRVVAVAVLADGRVVSGGGDGRVRLWDSKAPTREPLATLACTVRALATGPSELHDVINLVIAHSGGLSIWSTR